MSLLKHARVPLALTAILTALQAPHAWAQDHGDADRDAGGPGGSTWGLGVGASIARSRYKGIGNDNVFFPLVTYESRVVKLFGNVLDIRLPSEGPLDFALRAKVGLGEGYRASRSPYLSGMKSRSDSIYLGAVTTWHAGFADLSVDYLKDVSGNSKGSRLQFGIDRAFIFDDRYLVTPHASVTRLDAKYVDYYDGVEASEATATRPAYLGKSATETELGVRFGWLVTRNQRLLLDVSDTHWGSGISSSPIVDRKSTPGLKIGYLHGF